MPLLGPDTEAAVEELLLEDPISNLFLLGLLDRWPLDRWYGIDDGGRLLAVVAVLPDLVVPFALPEAPLQQLHGDLATHRPTMVVGPRAVCDGLLPAWSEPEVRIQQRLYVCEATTASDLPVRQAHEGQLDTITSMGLRMEAEDLGRLRDPEAHRMRTLQRIRHGRVWVAEVEGQVGFSLNVGTATVHGCQVGGTYVPEHLRGRGIASRAMASVTHALLERFPRVTLHVREENAPAVRAYERAGFRRSTPFRVAMFERR